MKQFKLLQIFSLLNSYQIDTAQPDNFSYYKNIFFLLGVYLALQIIIVTVDLTAGINFELILSGPFLFYNKFTEIRNYINSFDFIKGIKYIKTFSLLPSIIANFHIYLLGRIFRVVGGLSAFITLTFNTQFAILHTKNIFFYLIAFIGLCHMLYIMFIFALKFSYLLYYIFTRKWILSYFSFGSAIAYCIIIVCVVSGLWLATAATAVMVDIIIAEDYFKLMGIIKLPAFFFKSLFV